jgi:hypothetical protein
MHLFSTFSRTPSLLPHKVSAISHSLFALYIRSRLVPPRRLRMLTRCKWSEHYTRACQTSSSLQLILVHQSAFLDQCYNIFLYEHVTLSIRWHSELRPLRPHSALPHADGGGEPCVCVAKWWSRSFRMPSAAIRPTVLLTRTFSHLVRSWEG